MHLLSQDARLIGVAARRWRIDVGDPDVTIEIADREDHWLIDFKIAMHRHRRKWAMTTVSLLIDHEDLGQAFDTFGKHLSELRRKVQLFDFTNQ